MKILLIVILLLLLCGCYYYYPTDAFYTPNYLAVYPSVDISYWGSRFSFGFSTLGYGVPYSPYYLPYPHYLSYPRWDYYEPHRPYFYYKPYGPYYRPWWRW